MDTNTILADIRKKIQSSVSSKGKSNLDAITNKISDVLEPIFEEETKKRIRLKFELKAKQDEIERIRKENFQFRRNSTNGSTLTSEKNPSLETLENKNQKLLQMLQSREEELNRLYNLTESDMKYRCYYIVRDEAPHWVNFSDIYRFINLPPGEVQKNLKDFSMRGLVEIQDKNARAKLVIRKTTV